MSSTQPDTNAKTERLTRRPLDVLLFALRWIVRPFAGAANAFFAFIAAPPLTNQLPPPPRAAPKASSFSPDELGELVLHNLFRLPSPYLRAVIRIARAALAVPRFAPERRLAIFVHFSLSRIPEAAEVAIPIGWIRTRMPDVGRSELNRALEQLEGDGWVRLKALEINDEAIVIAGISDPARGRLTHIELVFPL